MLITLLTGNDLDRLVEALGVYTEHGALGALRIHQESDGRVKFKFNAGMWTPGMGEMDPDSDLFHRRRDEEGRYRTLTDPDTV